MDIEGGDDGVAGDDTSGRVLLLHSQSESWSLMDYLLRCFSIAMTKHRLNFIISVYFWLCIHWLIISPDEFYGTLNIWHTIVIVYLIYLYECFYVDDSSKFITSHVMTLLEFEAYMECLIDTSILLKFSGSHMYGTSAFDRTKDKTEQVYTYNNFVDKTKRIELIHPLTKVRCKKEWVVWSDVDGSFHTQREQFIHLHEIAYGKHNNNYSEKIHYKNALYYPAIIVCRDREHLPHILRTRNLRCAIYYISMLCGAAWFFRIWLDSVTKNADFRINKAIKFGVESSS